MADISIDPIQPTAAQPTPQGELAKVIIVTDTWESQVSGVVHTLIQTRRELEVVGHIVDTITPLEFKTMSCPTYSEIRLSILPSKRVRECIERFAPQALHIATEGPLGLAVHTYVLRCKLPYTTAYHTRFSEYVQTRFGTPLAWTYRFLRWFHSPVQVVMAPMLMALGDLADCGITSSVLWTRGVGLDIFTAQRSSVLNMAHPIFLYVGRVTVEKNIGASLELDLPGSKWVVGEGPVLTGLKAKCPNASYLGVLKQPELTEVYASADVFVFPSRTDTSGLVLLEALTSGLSVVVYPVADPIDALDDSPVGALREDLREAYLGTLRIDCVTTRAHAEEFL